jgi:predicted nucleic-acid-binding Zn-ribbon protein
MSPATRTITPETRAKIDQALSVLRDRGATNDYCPRCSKNNWDVDLLAIPATSLPNAAPAFGSVQASPLGYIPLVTIMCTTCGYTILHNLNVLGIDFGVSYEPT